MRLAERQGEIGEERLGLFGWEDQRSTALEARFKSAKKLELQVRLGRHRSSSRPQPATTLAQITSFSTVLATIRIRSPDTTEEEAAAFRTEGVEMTELTLNDLRRSVDRDADLVEALRQQETGSIEALIALYGDRVYRLATRITGNRPDAEEVVQDAFLIVVRKIDTFRGDSAFGSWLYRIVSNAAYGRRRAQASVEIPLEVPTFDEHGRHVSVFRDWSASVDDPAVQKELRDVLTSAIDELPAHYRAAFVLRDVEGLSTAEVAGSLGIPAQTAKTRAHRARLLLRKRLSTFMDIEGFFETEVPTRPSQG